MSQISFISCYLLLVQIIVPANAEYESFHRWYFLFSGGCKHAVAFLSWLNRRSEEPAKTEVLCYWRRSKMAEIGTTVKFILCENMGSSQSSFKKSEENDFLMSLVAKTKERNVRDSTFIQYFDNKTDEENLSLHHLRLNVEVNDAESFITYCKKKMTLQVCEEAAIATLEQADCEVWHELRYGRITASKVHEAANCKTSGGSLVEHILGAKLPPSVAINRGRCLENEVFKHLKSTFENIKKCGLLLSPEYPIFGASPDGISDTYVFEIKCPMTDKWKEVYFKNNKPKEKFLAQLQMQMKFAKKLKGVFVVATPEYENNKELIINVVDYDPTYVQDLMDRAQKFWKDNIFKKLYQ
jgi:hypothetical protein